MNLGLVIVFFTFFMVMLIFIAHGVIPEVFLTNRFRKRHTILVMPAGDAIRNTIDFFLDRIMLSFLHKVIFIFTPVLYKEKVLREAGDSIKKSYKTQISDLIQQRDLLTDDRNKWQRAWHDQREATGENYWKRAKYGFSLGEKKIEAYGMKLGNNYGVVQPMSDEENKAYEVWRQTPEYKTLMKKLSDAARQNKAKGDELTISHKFALKQIVKGNRTVSGMTTAYLEDHGYVKLVWDDEKKIRYHYEPTANGIKYAKKNIPDNVETDEINYPVLD